MFLDNLKEVILYCICLIVDSYVRQISRVSWGNHLSQYFELSNGVKQGGVLSPNLFSIYIDKLLLELKRSGYGCHINNTFVGALCYANDVTLLSPSIRDLNAMISLCEAFAKNFDITFNCKKTVFIKFVQKLIGSEHVYLNDKKIEWVNQIKDLGNYIDRNLNDNIDCTHKKSIFIGQVNKFCANFGYLQLSVLVRLFKTYCCTFYGSQMWQVNSQYINSVCTSWNEGVKFTT